MQSYIPRRPRTAPLGGRGPGRRSHREAVQQARGLAPAGKKSTGSSSNQSGKRGSLTFLPSVARPKGKWHFGPWWPPPVNGGYQTGPFNPFPLIINDAPPPSLIKKKYPACKTIFIIRGPLVLEGRFWRAGSQRKRTPGALARKSQLCSTTGNVLPELWLESRNFVVQP